MGYRFEEVKNKLGEVRLDKVILDNRHHLHRLLCHHTAVLNTKQGWSTIDKHSLIHLSIISTLISEVNFAKSRSGNAVQGRRRRNNEKSVGMYETDGGKENESGGLIKV